MNKHLKNIIKFLKDAKKAIKLNITETCILMEAQKGIKQSGTKSNKK